MEQALGGPYMPVAILPEKDQILSAKLECRLPLEIFEEVLRAATDACHQVSRKPEGLVRKGSGSMRRGYASVRPRPGEDQPQVEVGAGRLGG